MNTETQRALLDSLESDGPKAEPKSSIGMAGSTTAPICFYG